jgi:hypothetical protein
VQCQTVNGSCAVLYGGMLEDDGSSWGEKKKMVVVHIGENMKKIRVKRRVTDGRGENGCLW